jgi:UPF0755 protein
MKNIIKRYHKHIQSTQKKVRAFLSKVPWKRIASVMGLFVVLGTVGMSLQGILAPKDFPVGRIVTIEEGSTVHDITKLFEEKKIITSPLIFKMIIRLTEKETAVQAGDYFFEDEANAFAIAHRITHGEYGLEPVKVTIPEGSTTLDIAALFPPEEFPKFDPSEFLELTQEKEGYLFPDTYFFLPNVQAPQVIGELSDTFNVRIAELEDMIASSTRAFEDIIIMASIIEKEAWKEEDRRLISGVLWNRIDIGMPLQVDATFLYINGRNTYELTLDDLAIDSPYNTYKYKGLPKGPICNPSLSSIKAALDPEESAYLFYLADRYGNTYYSLDFEDHKRNKRIHID